LKPFAAAAFSPWRPKPKPPKRAPGVVEFSGMRGVSECWLADRERFGAEEEDAVADRFSVTMSQAVAAIRV
jgi:hypothetical protein